MAATYNLGTMTAVLAADTGQFIAVKLDTTGALAIAGAGDADVCIGTTNRAGLEGESIAVSLFVGGVVRLLAGEAITVGERVSIGAGGEAVADAIGGLIALVSGAENDVIQVVLAPQPGT